MTEDRVKVIECGHYITLRIDGNTAGQHDFAPSNKAMFAEIHISNEELFVLGARIASVLQHRIQNLQFKRHQITEVLERASEHGE